MLVADCLQSPPRFFEMGQQLLALIPFIPLLGFASERACRNAYLIVRGVLKRRCHGVNHR